MPFPPLANGNETRSVNGYDRISNDPHTSISGVYYLSVAAAGFLVFIIVLAIIKYILFVILFILTGGKLKLWIFPNLTEDVGFFESFVPAYVYTYDKPKKDKDSDDEESSDEEEVEEEKGESEPCVSILAKLMQRLSIQYADVMSSDNQNSNYALHQLRLD